VTVPAARISGGCDLSGSETRNRRVRRPGCGHVADGTDIQRFQDIGRHVVPGRALRAGTNTCAARPAGREQFLLDAPIGAPGRSA